MDPPALRGRTFRLLLSLLAVTTAAQAQDTLILRDGTRRTGSLKACAGPQCRLDGETVARAAIVWIGFATAESAPAPPADDRQDAIVLRDGRTVAGEVRGISLGVVTTAVESFDRSAVAWIYFGAPRGRDGIATGFGGSSGTPTSGEARLRKEAVGRAVGGAAAIALGA